MSDQPHVEVPSVKLEKCPVCDCADFADDGNTIRPFELGEYHICHRCGFAFDYEDAGPEPREFYWAAARLVFDSGHHFWGGRACKANEKLAEREKEVEALRERVTQLTAKLEWASQMIVSAETTDKVILGQQAKITTLEAALRELTDSLIDKHYYGMTPITLETLKEYQALLTPALPDKPQHDRPFGPSKGCDHTTTSCLHCIALPDKPKESK